MCERPRADSRLSFTVAGAATVCICMQHVYKYLRADSRLGFIFVGAATAGIVIAARVRPSSGGFAFRFELCWGGHR